MGLEVWVGHKRMGGPRTVRYDWDLWVGRKRVGGPWTVCGQVEVAGMWIGEGT